MAGVFTGALGFLMVMIVFGAVFFIGQDGREND